MKEDKWTIHLGGRVNAYPVVTTGERWPAIREGQETRSFDRALFGGFPFLKNDERWQDYGSRKDEPDNPPQGARGGGLFPVIALLPDGRIACVTRTGATHSIRPGAQLSLSFSEDRGRTWSPYRVVVEKEEDDARNPALGSTADGTLVLAYGIHSVGESRCLFEHIEVIRSLDGGETWSAPHRVEYDLDGVLLHPYGRMLQVAPHTLVFNARGYYSPNRYQQDSELPRRESYLFWSYDDGVTWNDVTLIGHDKSETGFLPLDADHWIAYIRVNYGPTQLAYSSSGGWTWERWEDLFPAAREGCKPSSYTAPGHPVQLPSGKVILVYTYRDYPFGVRAIRSHDGGATFDREREYVLVDSYWHYDCGYPSTVCFDDGTIVTVAYTIFDMAHPEWGTCAIAYVYDQEVFEE